MNSPNEFSLWMRSNLKNSYSGLITQDIDFIILNNKNQFLIVEEKLYQNARTGPAQAIIYKMLYEILSVDPTFKGCFKISNVIENTGYLNDEKKIIISDLIFNPDKYLNEFRNIWYEEVITQYLPWLWDCKSPEIQKKTIKENTFSRKSNLKKYLNKNKIKYESIDWIFVNYCSGNFIILNESEEKTILKRITNIFINHKKSEIPVRNPKSNSKYNFLGTYNITYEKDFSFFYINNKKVAKEDAIKVLNLDDENIVKYI